MSLHVMCAIDINVERHRGDRDYGAIRPAVRWNESISIFSDPYRKQPKGNEYVLMMVDQFTKWIECIALPTQTAEETATAAVNEFFARFGYPFEIFTDQRQKGGDLTQSYDKSPYTNRNVKGAK